MRARSIFFSSASVIVALTVGLVFFLLIFFANKYRHGSKAERSGPAERPGAARVAWTTASLLIFVGLAMWGADLYLHLYNPPPDALQISSSASNGCGRRSTRAASARSTSCMCPPASRAAGDGVAGRDPQLLRAGPADQAGRRARPLRDDVVPRRQGRALPFVLRRILRDRPCAHGRLAHGHEAARFRRLAAAQGGQETLAAQGQQLFRRYGCSGCHERRRRRFARRGWRASSEPRAAVGRKRRHCRRALRPRFHPRPARRRSRPATRRSCRPSRGRSAKTISPSSSPTSNRFGPRAEWTPLMHFAAATTELSDATRSASAPGC